MNKYMILLCAVIVVSLVSCNDRQDNVVTIPNDLLEQRSQSSGQSEDFTLIDERLKNIPNLGEWVVFKSIDEWIAYRQQYGLDEILGDEVVADVVEKVAELSDKPLLRYISPEENNRYRELYLKLMKEDNTLSEQQIDENLRLFDEIYFDHAERQRLQKSKSSLSTTLASVPQLNGQKVEEGSHEQFVPDDPTDADAYAYGKIERPYNFEMRTPAAIGGGWVVEPQEPGFFSGKVWSITISNYGCNQVYLACYTSTDSVASKSYFTAPSGGALSSISFDGPSTWSVHTVQCSFLALCWNNQTWTFDPWYTCLEQSSRQTTSDVDYEMGGRGDLDFSLGYTMDDVYICLDLISDPGQMNEYEEFACDANMSGTYTVADALQIELFIRNGLCP